MNFDKSTYIGVNDKLEKVEDVKNIFPRTSMRFVAIETSTYFK
jgi:hypothetical protein